MKIQIYNVALGQLELWIKNGNDWRYIRRLNAKTWK